MININIFNEYQNEIEVDFNKITNDIIKTIPIFLGDIVGDISLILVDNKKIRMINNQYRNKDYETDVISFEDDEDGYLGEIFISIDKMISQSIEFGHSVTREGAFLVCHGVLHLLGYDHMTKEEETIMFDMQEKILNEMGYKR